MAFDEALLNSDDSDRIRKIQAMNIVKGRLGGMGVDLPSIENTRRPSLGYEAQQAAGIIPANNVMGQRVDRMNQLPSEGEHRMPMVAAPTDPNKTPPVTLPGIVSGKTSQPTPSTIASPNPATGLPAVGRNANELNRLQTTGSGIHQIHNPFLKTLATIGDVAGSLVAPQAMRFIPGTTLHHQMLVNEAQGGANEDAGLAQKQAQTEAEQAGKARTEAETEKIRKETEEAGQPKPKEEQWTLSPDGKHLVERNSGTVKAVPEDDDLSKTKPQEPISVKSEGGIPTEVVVPDAKGNKKQYAADDPNLPPEAKKIVDAYNKAHGIVKKEQEDKEARAEERANKKEERKAATSKATADEQRRADLANNLSENLDALEDIIKRRPELFGSVAGRITGFRQWTGTSDPDVAKLKNIEEQTGLAMVGAHAMRNAQHAEKAAQSITNAYKNSPEATLGAIATARESLKTFMEDVQNKQPGAAKGGTIRARDPKGVLHEAPAGTPLPKGWKKE